MIASAPQRRQMQPTLRQILAFSDNLGRNTKWFTQRVPHLFRDGGAKMGMSFGAPTSCTERPGRAWVNSRGCKPAVRGVGSETQALEGRQMEPLSMLTCLCLRFEIGNQLWAFMPVNS